MNLEQALKALKALQKLEIEREKHRVEIAYDPNIYTSVIAQIQRGILVYVSKGILEEKESKVEEPVPTKYALPKKAPLPDDDISF